MKVKQLCAVMSAIALVGCGSSPDCGSSSGEKLITGIVKDQNLLGNLYILLLGQKIDEGSKQVGSQQSEQVNKLSSDLQVVKQEIQQKMKDCVPAVENSAEVAGLKSNAQQLSDQKRVIETSRPMNTSKLIEVNQSLGYAEAQLRSTLEFIGFACRGEGEKYFAAAAMNPNKISPLVVDTVNKYIATNINPLIAKSNQINDALNAANAELKNKQDEQAGKITEKAKQDISDAKLKLVDVVTINKNKETGAVQCRAKLTIDVKDLVQSNATIYYKLEQTSKGDLYGTVTGIE